MKIWYKAKRELAWLMFEKHLQPYMIGKQIKKPEYVTRQQIYGHMIMDERELGAMCNAFRIGDNEINNYFERC